MGDRSKSIVTCLSLSACSPKRPLVLPHMAVYTPWDYPGRRAYMNGRQYPSTTARIVYICARNLGQTLRALSPPPNRRGGGARGHYPAFREGGYAPRQGRYRREGARRRRDGSGQTAKFATPAHRPWSCNSRRTRLPRRHEPSFERGTLRSAQAALEAQTSEAPVRLSSLLLLRIRHLRVQGLRRPARQPC